MVAPVSAGSAQIRDIIAMTGPSVVVAPDALVPLVRAAAGPTRCLPTRVVSEAPPLVDAPAAPRDPDAPSIVIFTSGTTSRPKGVIHSLNTMLVASRNYIDTAWLTPDDNLFVISPLASVTGMQQAVVVAPLLGAQLTLESRFDEAATLDFI